tara:strand:- start:6872 stop:7816 length:945 start_codon:yes stop_codon:yes gene_type:complete
MKPLISIVINNFNYQQYIGKAIESALEQTYENVEVIIVDDGSTDDSRSIIQSYNIDKVIFKENGGQTSALNVGFTHTRGDIVIFLDSDDYLYPECCKVISDAHNKTVSMYPYKLRVVNENNDEELLTIPIGNILTSSHCEYIMKYGCFDVAPMSGVAYSRFFLENYFPFDGIKWNNSIDHFLSFTAPFYGDVVSIDKCLGAYRVGHASISQHKLISLDKFRLNLLYTFYYCTEIAYLAKIKFNMNLEVNKVLGPYHWKNRLFSYSINKELHPFKSDRKLIILYYSIWSFLTWKSIPLSKRILNIFIIPIIFFVA